MKRKLFIFTAVTMLLATVPAYAEEPMYMAPPGMKIEVEITYDENGRKVITTHCSPENGYSYPSTNEKMYMSEGYEFKKLPPLTEAPEVGTVLAHIMDETAESNIIEDWAKCTPPYQDGNIGQCTWYARGRYMEVFGKELSPYLGRAKDWVVNAQNYEELLTELNIDNPIERSIAVYVPIYDKSLAGHVNFIEYIERDVNGKPLNIYYTDANGKYDLKKNEYSEGYDGAVVKESFAEFQGTHELKLVGYIYPNNEIEK